MAACLIHEQGSKSAMAMRSRFVSATTFCPTRGVVFAAQSKMLCLCRTAYDPMPLAAIAESEAHLFKRKTWLMIQKQHH